LNHLLPNKDSPGNAASWEPKYGIIETNDSSRASFTGIEASKS
jgi:hypothetical protein